MMEQKLIKEVCFVGIDFESAGAARGRTDVPVQVGLADWSVAGGLAEAFDSYLATEEKITWAARKVHGIMEEDLIGAPSLMEMWPTFKKRLGAGPVVAHGHGTEKRFLRAFPGHGFGPWVDTLLLARAAWPELESHALGSLCDHLGLTDFKKLAPERKWHDALFDTLASLELLGFLVREFDLAERELGVLLSPDISRWQSLRG